MVRKIALIGAGRIGKVHAATIDANPNAVLSHIVDPVAEAAQALAARHGGKPATLAEALAADIDAILIASATDTHADLIEQAAAAGKAVFCEKPIDLDVARARACVARAKAAGVVLFVGFNRRFDPNFAHLKAQIDAGAIGELEMLHITSRDPGAPPASYAKVSGGIFKDMTIHDFDMARWLLGKEPVTIAAQASSLIDADIQALGDFDSALVTMRTASGKLCVISNSRRASYGYDQRIEAHGSAGMVAVGNELENLVQLSNANGTHNAKAQNFFLERYANAYRHELNHFLDILDNRATPLVDGDDGVRALILAEAAAQACKTGKTITVDA